MIYGKVFLESNNVQNVEPFDIVFEEYLNRKSMLAECTNLENRRLLEAQIEVLREVSFSSIIDKIVEIFKKIVRFIEKAYLKVIELLTGDKYDSIKGMISAYKNYSEDKLNWINRLIKSGRFDAVFDLEKYVDMSKISDITQAVQQSSDCIKDILAADTRSELMSARSKLPKHQEITILTQDGLSRVNSRLQGDVKNINDMKDRVSIYHKVLDNIIENDNAVEMKKVVDKINSTHDLGFFETSISSIPKQRDLLMRSRETMKKPQNTLDAISKDLEKLSKKKSQEKPKTSDATGLSTNTTPDDNDDSGATDQDIKDIIQLTTMIRLIISCNMNIIAVVATHLRRKVDILATAPR